MLVYVTGPARQAFGPRAQAALGLRAQVVYARPRSAHVHIDLPGGAPVLAPSKNCIQLVRASSEEHALAALLCLVSGARM